MADEILYKPHELYEKRLQKQFHDEAEKYFDKLTEKGAVDVGANQVHVKAYNEKKDEIENSGKRLKKLKTGKVFIIISFFLVIGLLLIPLLISVNKKIKEQNLLHVKLEQEAKDRLNTCYKDLALLNSLYDWNMPVDVMETATPIIGLDPVFTPERLCYLKEKFGLSENDDPTASTVGVLSGIINGNPFILEKRLNEDTKEKKYTGSITISWTTTVRTNNGTQTVHHTQTLTAEVWHPAPYYAYETRLIYGNEAAPHLQFSRSPSNAHTMNPKQRQKAAEKGAKELRKKAEKSLVKNPTGHVFTPMGNDAFDTFFGGTDRNNEVEFRLLFTPLAQQNELDIITNPNPYGDDFYMVKDKMITSVASIHSQNFDYSADPSRFVHYDVKAAKQIFVDYCDAFIKNLYFDLAPIISIPLYQMHKPHEFIYKDTYPTNITSYEHEVMANHLNKSYFSPNGAGSDLPLILKSMGGRRDGQGDVVNIHAYSFRETPMVDYVSKLGGDGKMHTIPVHWIKYDKVTKDSPISVQRIGSTKKNVEGSGMGGYYQRGLLAFAQNGFSQKQNEIINNLSKEQK